MRKTCSIPNGLNIFIGDMVHEYQLEAVTHTPAYISGPCLSSSERLAFMEKLDAPQTMLTEVEYDIASCIASPSMPVEESSDEESWCPSKGRSRSGRRGSRKEDEDIIGS